MGQRQGWILILVLAGSGACDRPPSSDGVKEWTPADHDGEKGAGATSRQGARQVGAGGAPALVEITWRNQCASCHGFGGKGDGPQGAMFKPPDLTASTSDDATLLATIKNGKGRMPKFELPDDVAEGLAVKVKSLRGN
jgi:cytochrome c oxidase cbb3-type subunit 3